VADSSRLLQRIGELETELKSKEQELARYRQEISRANAQLEKVIVELGHDLKMAGLIQKLLSPTQLPNISGVEFSTKFVPGLERGGDYFDIFEHQDRLRFGIVVASCTGYTMSALFLSVLIKMASQIEARTGMEPHLVIESMAKELLPQIQNSEAASLFYGFVDRRTFELKYTLVGGITAVLQSAQNGSIARLIPSAPALEKNFNGKPLSQNLQLGPKDRLIICTEGLAEVADRQGKVLGQEGLLKYLQRLPRSSVHDVRNDILFKWEQFVGHHEPARDLTVVVAEIKDKLIKLAK
jgi:sigma-B regulation protein RsbU (phosphoserine phosphatase)